MGIRLSDEIRRLLDGRDPDPDPPGSVRVILRMTVEKAAGLAA